MKRDRALTIADAEEGELSLLIVEAVKGAVEGGVAIGADPAETAKGIMAGVLAAADAEEAEDAIVTVARTVREQARRHGWDPDETTRGLVAGAVEAGPDAGVAPERVVGLVHESMQNE